MLNNNKSEKRGWGKLIHFSIFLLCAIVVATALSMTVSHGSIAHAASSSPSSSSSSSSSGKSYSFIKSSQIQLGKNDESRKVFFHPLFGNVSNFSFQNSPISGVIMAFNSAVLFIAGILAAYTMLAGTVNTAHDGELLGQKWSSSWMPIRTALGAASLLPVFQGFCFAQVLVIWLAMQGAGLANYTWHKYTTNLGNSITFLNTFNQQQMYNAAFNMYISNVCTMSLYHSAQSVTMKKAVRNKYNLPNYVTISQKSKIREKLLYGVNTNKINYNKSHKNIKKQKNAKPTNATPICGTMTLQLIPKKQKNSAKNSSKTSGYYGIHINNLNPSNLKTLTHKVSQAKLQAFNMMQNRIEELAYEAVYHKGHKKYNLKKRNFSPVVPLYHITQKYTNTINKTINNVFQNKKFLSKFKSNINKDGWLFAGAWYLKIIQMQRAINGVASQIPKQGEPIQENVNGYSTRIKKNVQTAKQFLGQKATGLSKQTGSGPKGPQTANKKRFFPRGTPTKANKSPMDYVGQALKTPLYVYDWFVHQHNLAQKRKKQRRKRLKKKLAQKKAKNNLISSKTTLSQAYKPGNNSRKPKSWVQKKAKQGMKIIYKKFMQYATQAVNPVIIAEALGHIIIDAGWTVLGIGAVAGIFSTTAAFSAVALTSTLFTIGAGLAVIIPMTPFVIWVSVILSWMIMVAQAVVGAPLWALAHMQPDADGLVGRAGQGYMLVLGLTIKPTLMIVGLVLAITLIMPFGYFFNSIFTGAFLFVNNGKFGGAFGIIELIAVLFLYWSMLMMILKKSFSLIHLVPDQILSWLNAGLPQLGGDAREMQQTTNQEMQNNMQQAQKMTGQAASVAGQTYLGHKQAGIARSGLRENSQMAQKDQSNGNTYAEQAQQYFKSGEQDMENADEAYQQGNMSQYNASLKSAQSNFQSASDYKEQAMNSYNSASKRLDAAKESASQLMRNGSVKDRMAMSGNGPNSLNNLERSNEKAQSEMKDLQDNTPGLEDKLKKVNDLRKPNKGSS